MISLLISSQLSGKTQISVIILKLLFSWVITTTFVNEQLMAFLVKLNWIKMCNLKDNHMGSKVGESFKQNCQLELALCLNQFPLLADSVRGSTY